MQKKILIVDSNKKNLAELSDILTKEGYLVVTHADPMTIRATIIICKPDLLIMGTDFDNFDGLDLCERVKKDPLIRFLPIIVTSDERNERVLSKSFEIGAVDFFSKPYHRGEIKARIETHIKLNELNSRLDEENKKLESTVEEQNKTIAEMQMATIFSLAKLAQSRDDDTGKHLERVQKYCFSLASELAKNPDFSDVVTKNYIKNVVFASALHDIGKVSIPDSILLKPGKLTPEEFDIMKTHTTLGAKTLEEVNEKFAFNDFIRMGISIAKYHHERWDGKGYPEGLKGRDIPLCARIMAIADVYDALSSKRTYKDAFPHAKCIEIIKEGRGTQFDATLVDVFLTVQDEFALIRQLYGDTKAPLKFL